MAAVRPGARPAAAKPPAAGRADRARRAGTASRRPGQRDRLTAARLHVLAARGQHEGMVGDTGGESAGETAGAAGGDLAGKLLVAAPGLLDPNFARSVVLILDSN